MLQTVNKSMSSYKSIICDANHLYEAYLKSIKSSKWKESTQRYMLNFLDHIFALQAELEDMTYHPSEEGEFILRERGKIRAITSLQPRDRIVRHVLCDDVLLPVVRAKLIYDNGASLEGKGMSFSRKRFEVHLHKYFTTYGTNEGYILLGDFRKFYDNILHSVIKKELLKLVDDDEYVAWLLDVIFENFKVDVSYMTDEEYDECMNGVFNALEYRNTIPKSEHTGEKFLSKSVNIGDQISQIIGIFYPYRIDNYVKTVRSQKFYGRYMDDWYVMSPSKEELEDILENIKHIAADYGIHINTKKTRIVKLSSTYKYLQVRYTLTSTGKVIKRINPQRVTAFRRKLKKLAALVNDNKAKYEDVENMFRSWMGGNYKLMSKETRIGLLNLFEDLFDVEITFVKHEGAKKHRMIITPKGGIDADDH